MIEQLNIIQKNIILEKLDISERKEKLMWRLASIGMYLGYLLDNILHFGGAIIMLSFVIAVLLLILYLNEGNGMSFQKNLKKSNPELPSEFYKYLSIPNRAHAAQLAVFVYIFFLGMSEGSFRTFFAILIFLYGIAADQWWVYLAKERRVMISSILTHTVQQ